MYTKITTCRICSNQDLRPVLDLGEQMLTGVFPRERDARVTVGPLRLVKCQGELACGLLQLEHSYDLGEMYGDNYGYRSGLNQSMVKHLHAKVRNILAFTDVKAGDLVVDIGSNDSTTLQGYAIPGVTYVGIDPTSEKFRAYYPEGIALIPDFFSASLLTDKYPGRKAKVVTSFSMFYDLEDPVRFMQDVSDVLADDGIWVFEQSYMPTMLQMNSFDTACHEHLEYYALKQIDWMCCRTGLKVVDVEFNDVNGGSFSITACKAHAKREPMPIVAQTLAEEVAAGLDTLAPYEAFAAKVAELRKSLLAFIAAEQAKGKKIAAIGASTKGNVLLQYCHLTPEALVAVGEVNPEKFGAFTPGTWIPIVPEADLLASDVDFFLVLPWHFRAFFAASPAFKGKKLVFPLPQVEVVIC